MKLNCLLIVVSKVAVHHKKYFFVVLFNSATPTCAHTCAYFQNIFF